MSQTQEEATEDAFADELEAGEGRVGERMRFTWSAHISSSSRKHSSTTTTTVEVVGEEW